MDVAEYSELLFAIIMECCGEQDALVAAGAAAGLTNEEMVEATQAVWGMFFGPAVDGRLN